MIARQEFIKQLSLWDEDEDSSEEEDTKQVPLPGEAYKMIINTSYI